MNRTIILVLLVCLFSFSFSQSTNKAKTEVIQLTQKEFLRKIVDYKKNPKEWIYLGDKPCIVEFYADWCGPCKRLAPILEELAQEYKGKIYIYKVNTAIEKELAQDFNVRSIPTIIFCPMNDNPQMGKGALSKETLVTIIETQLLKKKTKKRKSKKE